VGRRRLRSSGAGRTAAKSPPTRASPVSTTSFSLCFSLFSRVLFGVCAVLFWD
jgi:hypothetical protein